MDISPPGLPKGDIGNTGQIDGLHGLCLGKFHGLAARGRTKTVRTSHGPTRGAQCGCVTEPALDFIGEAIASMTRLPDAWDVLRRQKCRNIIRRMGRFFGEIGVVEIEITD